MNYVHFQKIQRHKPTHQSIVEAKFLVRFRQCAVSCLAARHHPSAAEQQQMEAAAVLMLGAVRESTVQVVPASFPQNGALPTGVPGCCTHFGCTKVPAGPSGLCTSHGGSKKCAHPGCNNLPRGRGLCKSHGGGPRCTVEGCDKPSVGDGKCAAHCPRVVGRGVASPVRLQSESSHSFAVGLRPSQQFTNPPRWSSRQTTIS